jgi:hypothetical protein
MENLFKNMPLFFVIGIFVSLLKAFVVQSFWNWFAVPDLHLPSISFWATYGLLLLVMVVQEESSETENNKVRWDTVDYVMNLCLSRENIELVRNFLKEKEDAIWVTVGWKVFGNVTGIAATFAAGWIVHVFLAA